MDVCGWLITWGDLRTVRALTVLTVLTVTATADGGFNKDVTEKISLGDNLMNKIQRALRVKVIGDQPPAEERGPAGGASTSRGESRAGIPGDNTLAGIDDSLGRKDPTVTRLTNPYLDTTKIGDETSRYTFADGNSNDIQVATDHNRITDRSFMGTSNSTKGENRRAYDKESASDTEEEGRGGAGSTPQSEGGGRTQGTEVPGDKMEEFRRYVEQNPELLEQYVKMRAGAGRRGLAGAAGGWATPDPQQLDLAPARGGRIASKRLKGRVCQRSVLLPEGPKYDSRGRVYLAGFQRGARSFQQTRRPKRLLPRCCNCCRKSVLGCE